MWLHQSGSTSEPNWSLHHPQEPIFNKMVINPLAGWSFMYSVGTLQVLILGRPYMLLVGCASPFNLSRAPRWPRRLTLAQCWTTLIRCGSDLTALASVSSSRPLIWNLSPDLEFVVAANLFRNLFSSLLQVMACPRDFACHLCVVD